MPPLRPMLETWRATPWVTAAPIDQRTVGAILNEEVQVGVRGTGPMSQRELVPLTPAARELLHGTTRDGAERVFRGMLSTLDGHEGANNLRGFSLASDHAAFAAHMLMSNTEAGFFPDSVKRGDPAQLQQSLARLVPSVRAARAQNTGWMDLGPKVSEQLRSLIQHGSATARDAAAEAAQVVLHEAQHSISPHDPNTVSERRVWLEEGIAETLSWWPGRTGALMGMLGRPPAPGDAVDQWSMPPSALASQQYRDNHRAVLGLLGLAGVRPTREDGTPDATALARATQLLQGKEFERAPRSLARAIVREHRLDRALTPTIEQLVWDTEGRPERVDALRALVDQERSVTPGSGRTTA